LYRNKRKNNMNNNLHIYQFEVKIAVGGCGTTSYATVKKTVLAQNENEAKEKLHNELALTVSTVNLAAIDPHIK